MSREPRITSPYAPDLAEVRVWLERMIAALKFVELVAAILTLIGRMRDVNTELAKQLANLRRKRPRSETLERLERQLMLPLLGLSSRSRSRRRRPRTTRRPSKAARVGILAVQHRRRISNGCPRKTSFPQTSGSAPSAARR